MNSSSYTFIDTELGWHQ